MNTDPAQHILQPYKRINVLSLQVRGKNKAWHCARLLHDCRQINNSFCQWQPGGCCSLLDYYQCLIFHHLDRSSAPATFQCYKQGLYQSYFLAAMLSKFPSFTFLMIPIKALLPPGAIQKFYQQLISVLLLYALLHRAVQ